MMGLLAGDWVVGTSWIDACTAAGRALPEEDHEVAGDALGNMQGPILGRLQKDAREKLLTGFEVCILDRPKTLQ
jgi:hypothetical protein